MGRVYKVWKCGGIIGTLNYLITIRIVWTEYHYLVFVFGPFSKPEYIRYSVFGQKYVFGPTLSGNMCLQIRSVRFWGVINK